ncbi:ABC transporter substrate-binding protein [Ruminiclostridium papyrosolvens]|uniref:ABC transporter substrate-binding protein n=1 Tax=Ruminiclostridium papyrosolvens C7 TaxID=1330534 RepID=U4R5Z8_9FIRM|nr:sugar ABC transporter substrate-binding protein [Ruminiclostridium papyrosolvens]EPR14049.1 hypothetical protein L323_01520 [Ruminiclostridium papyrosolvens C7]
MKRFSKAMSLLVSSCLVVSMGLSGCGSSDSQQASDKSAAATSSSAPVKEVTYKVGYFSEQYTSTYEKACEGIEKVLPGVKVEPMMYPTDKDYWDNLPAQVAAGTAPDLAAMTNEKYLDFISNGLMLPLNESVIDLSKIQKQAVDAWKIDGKLYGIPLTAQPEAFIINMDMWNKAGLKELPKTLDDVKVAAKALTKDGVKGICIPDAEFHLTQYALAFGGGWGFGKTIDTPQNAQALQYLIDMFKDGVAITPKQAGLSWDGEVFAKGKCAMSTGGTWYIATLKEMAPDINYKMIPLPKGMTNGSTLHSIAIGVLKTAKDAEVAAKIAAYLVRDEVQQTVVKDAGAPPSSIAISDEYFANDPIVKDLKPVLAYAQPFAYPAAGQKFSEALIKGFDEAIYAKDSKKTGADIVKDVQALFK